MKATHVIFRHDLIDPDFVTAVRSSLTPFQRFSPQFPGMPINLLSIVQNFGLDDLSKVSDTASIDLTRLCYFTVKYEALRIMPL